MSLSIHIESSAGAGLTSFRHDFQTSVAGVFGPSGSGKTTLLETIAGVRRPPMTTGRITFNGARWLDLEHGLCLPPEQRCVGYVPQHHLLLPHRSVKANLLTGSRRALREGCDVEALLAQVVEALELGPLLGRYPAQLSGGERQRVALGRALCSGAKLLLLDEPLASLDQKLRYRIIPFLQRVRETFDVPMLIVSHQPTELQALCEEVVILEEGRLVDQGPPAEVFLKANVYTALSQADGYENVLTAYVVNHSKTLTVLRLCDAKLGPEVLITKSDLEVGQRTLLRLHAHEIMLAKEPVNQISARNRLPARIREIKTLQRKVMLVVEAGDQAIATLAVEVTPDAVESLELQAGDSVFLLIKSNSFLL